MSAFPAEGLRVRSTWPNGSPLCEFGLFGQRVVETTPEQMRALALMLLHAAEQTQALAKMHAPKGDAVAVTLTYPPLAGDALLQGLSTAVEKLLFDDWRAKKATAARPSECDGKTGNAHAQSQAVPGELSTVWGLAA